MCVGDLCRCWVWTPLIISLETMFLQNGVGLSPMRERKIIQGMEPRNLCLSICVCTQLLQSCLTLYNTIDCCLPGSSLHGISQARILEWDAISSSRESSWPRDWTHISCIVGGFFIAELLGKHRIWISTTSN